MKTAKSTIALLLALLALAAAGRTAEARPLEQVNRSAIRLQDQARQLNVEFNLHFRHTPQYQQMIADTADLYQQAAHIRQITRLGVAPRHLRDDVRKLDDRRHHLQTLVDRVEFRGRHGHGRQFDRSVEHVRDILDEIKDTIHDLEKYARELAWQSLGGRGPNHRTYGPSHGGHRPGHRRPAVQVGHSGHGGGAIQISRPGFSIRFGF